MPVNLDFNMKKKNDLEKTRTEDNVYEIKTNGESPYIYTNKIEQQFDPEDEGKRICS